jgi:hypothetical protein
MTTTLPSSNVVPFPAAADRPTFVVASKSWLKTTHAHPLLTDANKTFCTALYFYFNVKHYKKTGELIAWPAWDTVGAQFGLSKSTIYESIEQLERFRLLDVERGRYDRAAQKRTGNLYRVPARFGAASARDQGSYFEPNQGSNFEQDSYDSPSPLGESLDSVRNSGLPREEVRPRKLTEAEIASLKRLSATKGGR